MNRLQHFAKNLLLAFVLVTIGFAIGKETTLRSLRNSLPERAVEQASGRLFPVSVYYLHANARCNTCNAIENLTHDVLLSQFGDALKDGRLEWKVANFQEDEKLAQRYQVVSSGVILAKAGEAGKESFRSLDDVWTLVDNPAAFRKYVADAVRDYLSATPETGKAE